MPRPKNSVPQKRAHISGQDRVYLHGKHYYLGPSGSEEARGVKNVERALCPMNSEVAWVDVIRFSVEFERRQNGTGKK